MLVICPTARNEPSVGAEYSYFHGDQRVLENLLYII